MRNFERRKRIFLVSLNYAKSIKSNLDKVIKAMRQWEGTPEYNKIIKKLFDIYVISVSYTLKTS